MSWLNDPTEKLLKTYNTKNQTYVYAKKKGATDVVFSPQLAKKVDMESDQGFDIASKIPKPVQEGLNLEADPFRDLEVYMAQVNPAFMINPQTWMLGASRAMLGVKLGKITATPAISRFYFKLWDMLNSFPLIPADFKCASGKCFVSAQIGDDPGGFTQAIVHYRRRKFPDQYEKNSLVGIAKPSKFESGQKQKFLQLYGTNSGKVKIYHTAKTKNGDINDPESLKEYMRIFEKEPADLVTGDIGEDREIKDNAERHAQFQHTLFSEVLATLAIQKKGGNCVLKIMLDGKRVTAEILYLLYLHYDQLVMVKPITSIMSTSECYILGVNYHGTPDPLLKQLLSVHETWYKENKPLARLFENDLPGDFVEEFNKSRVAYHTIQAPFFDAALKVLKGMSSDANKEKTKTDLIKRICNNIFFAVDWCVANDVFLQGQYYLLRSPDRRPFKSDHSCFLALGQKALPPKNKSNAKNNKKPSGNKKKITPANKKKITPANKKKNASSE